MTVEEATDYLVNLDFYYHLDTEVFEVDNELGSFLQSNRTESQKRAVSGRQQT
jgi:hypothetical protein